MLKNITPSIKRSLKIAVLTSVIFLFVLACSVGKNETDTTVDDSPVQAESQNEEVASEEVLFDFEPAEPSGSPATTRSDPAPAGSEGVVDGMAFQIIDVVRPADALVLAVNQFGPELPAGKEYVMVNLEITCELNDNERCYLDVYNFKLVGEKGNVSYFDGSMINLEGLLEDSEFFGGASLSGSAIFPIDQGESGLTLLVDSYSDHPLFLALPEGE